MKSHNRYLKKLIKPFHGGEVKLPEFHHGHHGKGVMSKRVAEHKGRLIEVHTTYKFYVDGKPLKMHATVMDDGKVHCHSLPQYSFDSALKMLKRVVDIMCIERPVNELKKTKKKGHKTGGHHDS